MKRTANVGIKHERVVPKNDRISLFFIEKWVDLPNYWWFFSRIDK